MYTFRIIYKWNKDNFLNFKKVLGCINFKLKSRNLFMYFICKWVSILNFSNNNVFWEISCRFSVIWIVHLCIFGQLSSWLENFTFQLFLDSCITLWSLSNDEIKENNTSNKNNDNPKNKPENVLSRIELTSSIKIKISHALSQTS